MADAVMCSEAHHWHPPQADLRALRKAPTAAHRACPHHRDVPRARPSHGRMVPVPGRRVARARADRLGRGSHRRVIHHTAGPPGNGGRAGNARPDGARAHGGRRAHGAAAGPGGRPSSSRIPATPRCADRARDPVSCPKLAIEVALSPVRGAIWANDRYRLEDAYYRVCLQRPTGRSACSRPRRTTAGFGFSAGAGFVDSQLFGAHERLKMQGDDRRDHRATPTAWACSARCAAASVLSRWLQLGIDAGFARRPAEPFYGIGNGELVAFRPAHRSIPRAMRPRSRPIIATRRRGSRWSADARVVRQPPRARHRGADRAAVRAQHDRRTDRRGSTRPAAWSVS